jgi:hypothetical protein
MKITHLSKSMAIPGCFLAMALALPCSAATLAFYDIEGLTQASTPADGGEPTTTGFTASSIDATSADGTSTNFSFQGARMPYWFSDNVNDDANVTPTVSGSPGTGDILATFSLAPDAGQQISLGTTNVFDIGVLAYENSGSYTATARLFVASDAAFTNILATSTTISNNRAAVSGGTVTSSTAGTTSVGNTVGLLGLDNAVTSSSTLYFGVAMQENAASGNNSRFDGVGVYGTVSPVPEPGSFALLAGMFGLTWVMLRRRA